MAIEMRKCSGSKTFGMEAHEVPSWDFPIQPSQKDGLGRMCKPHWNQYTSALRKAALARKAEEGGDAPSARDQAKQARAVASEEIVNARRQARKALAKAPRVRRAKEVVAATESLGGKAYTDAIGSDEVQAALEVVAGGGSDDTFEQDVRAILA